MLVNFSCFTSFCFLFTVVVGISKQQIDFIYFNVIELQSNKKREAVALLLPQEVGLIVLLHSVHICFKLNFVYISSRLV